MLIGRPRQHTRPRKINIVSSVGWTEIIRMATDQRLDLRVMTTVDMPIYFLQLTMPTGPHLQQEILILLSRC